ncbi:MAG: polysaccharide biosynthesis/export family protein, partial [Alphaproteobacteria bacterium]
MPVVRLVMAAAVSALSLLLVGCSNLPQRDDVIAQATQDNEIAFNVVKIDDAVVGVLAARPRPPFRERFKEYLPPPELKIAVGDTVSVVIWEAASNGLFGNSLAEFPSRPGGATGRTRTEATQGGATRSGPLGPSDQRLERSPFMEPGAARPSAPSPMAMPIEPNANTAFAPPERNAIQELAARASQTAPGTSIPSQPVGPDGTITIPYAGRVVAAGRTATELGRRIEALLGPIAIDPQALVVVQRGAGSSVSVAGDAIQGGRVPLSSGGSRLLDVIAAAGGVATPAAETFVRLSRDGVTASVPLAVLIAHPDQNIPARPGDVLIVSRVPQTLTVFGAAGKNDLITFDAERLSLAEAL